MFVCGGFTVAPAVAPARDHPRMCVFQRVYAGRSLARWRGRGRLHSEGGFCQVVGRTGLIQRVAANSLLKTQHVHTHTRVIYMMHNHFLPDLAATVYNLQNQFLVCCLSKIGEKKKLPSWYLQCTLIKTEIRNGNIFFFKQEKKKSLILCA